MGVALLAAVAVGLPPAIPAARAEGTVSLATHHAKTNAIDELVHRLTHGPMTRQNWPVEGGDTAQHAAKSNSEIAEDHILAALHGARLSQQQSALLWEYFADEDNSQGITPSIIAALVAATDTPKARESLWSELVALARGYAKGDRKRTRDASLLGHFERSREIWFPLLKEIRETDPASDEIIELMLSTRVFGDDVYECVSRVSGIIPAAIARHIERSRELGNPVRWEYVAFESMARWKDAHLRPGGSKLPRTLDELDAAGETFIVIFNSFHTLDVGFREQMLRGLGAVELFNAVVAGEKELYRLGTSGYRDHLHLKIMRGIKDAGSFEAFVERTTPLHFGEAAAKASGRRSMEFLRVVSAFGLLEQVLSTVSDYDRFIDDAIASLGDPLTFQENSAVVMDLLSGRSGAAQSIAFRTELLERLYERFDAEDNAALRSVYGSMLSVYQTISGQPRNKRIASEYPLDASAFDIPFERLFTRQGDTGFIHRIFMRLDETIDDQETFKTFDALMRARDASVQEETHFSVFKLADGERTIEIYANKPTAQGLRQGIDEIAELLHGERIETVIGRGHTSIIEPLQKDARRLLGQRLDSVALVIVGSCGGDASLRTLIGTFGYIPFITTKSTGRQVINNAIIKTYISALFSLPTDGRLPITDVLSRATMRFLDWRDDDLRDDAQLYQVNRAGVLSARLFDLHVRPHAMSRQHLASE